MKKPTFFDDTDDDIDDDDDDDEGGFLIPDRLQKLFEPSKEPKLKLPLPPFKWGSIRAYIVYFFLCGLIKSWFFNMEFTSNRELTRGEFNLEYTKLVWGRWYFNPLFFVPLVAFTKPVIERLYEIGSRGHKYDFHEFLNDRGFGRRGIFDIIFRTRRRFHIWFIF